MRTYLLNSLPFTTSKLIEQTNSQNIGCLPHKGAQAIHIFAMVVVTRKAYEIVLRLLLCMLVLNKY